MLNLDKIASIIKDVAESEILPHWKNLQESQVKYKEQNNRDSIVTDADQRAEQAMINALAQATPHIKAFGEESLANEKDIIGMLKKENHFWMIDPIDGTYNFVHGKETFGVLLTLFHHGDATAAFIYHPIQNRMIIAEKGSGVYDNGVKTSLHPHHQKNPGIISNFIKDENAHKIFCKKAREFFEWTDGTWCSAHDFAMLADGTAEFLICDVNTPWDHGGGSLIYREAGGCVLHKNGTPYAPLTLSGGLVAAPTLDYCQEFINLLKS